MHLLLVEDNGTLIMLFQAQLRRLENHSLTTAATKTEALTAFQNETFDLIFIDMALEGIPNRGLEILREIKSSKPDQRVGILSSNDLRDTVKASQELGAEFYMVKPFTFRGLQVVLSGDLEAVQHYRPNVSEGPIIAL
ncbi:MAG: response regulator [Aliifodinibius sp.]|nr:response regulator [Fodinibius sp.]NIV16584.1 response regulator [Fodinibius sp.]NIY30563.1 response regulator [Fodinibius sp.]